MRMISKTFSGAGAAALAVATCLVLGSPARALDDDGRENVFMSLLSTMYIVPKDDAGPIDYHERAPLVLPPGSGLPPPVDAAPSRSAAWPNDPDVVKSKRANAQARAPMSQTRHGEAGLMGKDDLMAGRGDEGAAQPDYRSKRCQRGECKLTPDDLRALDAASQKSDSKALVAGQEPERKWLTDPPKGLRVPTKAVKATWTKPEIEKKDNAIDFFKNPFKHDDDDD